MGENRAIGAIHATCQGLHWWPTNSTVVSSSEDTPPPSLLRCLSSAALISALVYSSEHSGVLWSLQPHAVTPKSLLRLNVSMDDPTHGCKEALGFLP